MYFFLALVLIAAPKTTPQATPQTVPQATQQPALVIQVVGQVTHVDGVVRRQVHRFDKIPAGHTIETGPGARVALRLASGSLLSLGENTKLVLTEMNEKSETGTHVERFKLLIGETWARVMHLIGNQSKFEVEAEGHVAGVRGTEFWASVDGHHHASFAVASGHISLSTEGHQLSNIPAGMRASAAPGDAPKHLTRVSSGALNAMRIHTQTAGTMSRDATSAQADHEQQRESQRKNLLTRPDRIVDAVTNDAASIQPPPPRVPAVLNIHLDLKRE